MKSFSVCNVFVLSIIFKGLCMSIVILSVCVMGVICGVCYYKSVYDRIKDDESDKIPEDDWYM